MRRTPGHGIEYSRSPYVACARAETTAHHPATVQIRTSRAGSEPPVVRPAPPLRVTLVRPPPGGLGVLVLQATRSPTRSCGNRHSAPQRREPSCRTRRHQQLCDPQIERLVDVERILTRHHDASRVGAVEDVLIEQDARPRGDDGRAVAREEDRLVLPPCVYGSIGKR